MLYVAERLHDAAAADADGESIRILGFSNVSFQLLADDSPSGDVYFEGSFDADTWFPIYAELDGTDGITFTGSVAGIYHLLPTGAQFARLRWDRTSGSLTAWAGRFVRRAHGLEYYSTQRLHTLTAATGNGTPIDVRGMRGVTLHFLDEGTPVGTIDFEGTVNDTDWTPVTLLTQAGNRVSQITEAEIGQAFSLPETHGLSQIRAAWTRTSGSLSIASGKRP